MAEPFCVVGFVVVANAMALRLHAGCRHGGERLLLKMKKLGPAPGGDRATKWPAGAFRRGTKGTATDER
jgi:hypothetical protein